MENRIEYYQAYQSMGLDLLQNTQGKLFVIMDLETTGFNGSGGDQITQIAAGLVDGTTLEMVGDPFYVRAGLIPQKVDQLTKEVLGSEDPGYQSLHWVLALNHHHHLTQDESDHLKNLFEKGKIAQEEYASRLTSSFREVNLGPDYKGRDKIVKYKQPHKLSVEELSEVLHHDSTMRKSEEDSIMDFLKLVEDTGTFRFIGHNADGFDKKFFLDRCSYYGIAPTKMTVTDTMWLSRLLFIPAIQVLADNGDTESIKVRDTLNVFNNLSKLSSKLQDLRNAFGIPEEDAHTALGDIKVNLKVLVWIQQYLKKHNELLLGSLNSKFEMLKVEAFASYQKNDFRY
jgi:DNA polymerase III epsilon subunit-like protein